MRIVTIPRSWDPEVRRCDSRGGKEAEALAGLIGHEVWGRSLIV